jgi:hypothetical protein
MESLQQYLATLKTARDLVDASHEQIERSRELLDQYRRMRQLSHAADVQIAKASECLMVDVVRSEATAFSDDISPQIEDDKDVA